MKYASSMRSGFDIKWNCFFISIYLNDLHKFDKSSTCQNANISFSDSDQKVPDILELEFEAKSSRDGAWYAHSNH